MEGTTTVTEYAGLFVHKRGEDDYMISDRLDGFTNVAPGATWFRTRDEAVQGIDILKAVDMDGAKFWHLLRAIQYGAKAVRS